MSLCTSFNRYFPNCYPWKFKQAQLQAAWISEVILALLANLLIKRKESNYERKVVAKTNHLNLFPMYLHSTRC